MKLSVVILSKNEEAHIRKTLDSVAFAEEILLIDDNSSDQTRINAKRQKVAIYKKKLDDFATQRNFGFQKAKGDWVLFIDADEVASDVLQEDIKRVVEDRESKNVAYYIKRREHWRGRELKYGEVRKVREKGLLRLVRRNSGSWKGLVHESFNPTGPVGQLSGFMDHFPHPTLSEFLSSINFYSTLRAKELLKQGRSAGTFSIVFFPLGKFFTTFVLRKGFKDGIQGFVYSFLMSFHSFLVRTKLYQYKKLT